MGNLNGKTILIGKEENQNRLLVGVVVNDRCERAAIGTIGSVPACVSRLRSTEKAHCKIAVSESGDMVITNLNPLNTTYVDNSEIESKKVNYTSRIELGCDHYPIDLNVVMTAAGKIVDRFCTPPPGIYSIRHLEKVWDDYESGLEEIQRKQQKKAKNRMLPIMLGTVSGVASPVLASLLSTTTLAVTLPVTLVCFLLYFKMYREKDTSIEERKELQRKFYSTYVCPNPECKHFLQNQPYIVLRQNKKCAYCGCKITDQ